MTPVIARSLRVAPGGVRRLLCAMSGQGSVFAALAAALALALIAPAAAAGSEAASAS